MLIQNDQEITRWIQYSQDNDKWILYDQYDHKNSGWIHYDYENIRLFYSILALVIFIHRVFLLKMFIIFTAKKTALG